jgi:hypothetical protein
MLGNAVLIIEINRRVGTKTSALLVDPPFGYASPCAGFEPFVARR